MYSCLQIELASANLCFSLVQYMSVWGASVRRDHRVCETKSLCEPWEGFVMLDIDLIRGGGQYFLEVWIKVCSIAPSVSGNYSAALCRKIHIIVLSLQFHMHWSIRVFWAIAEVYYNYHDCQGYDIYLEWSRTQCSNSATKKVTCQLGAGAEEWETAAADDGWVNVIQTAAV